MKKASFIAQGMRDQFTKYSPDWLFPPIYRWLYPTGSRTDIKKVGAGWLIRRDEVEVLCPSPKWALMVGGFEDKFERFFRIEKGDMVLDVGACIGDTTVPMAIKIGSEGKVIAVEPHPLNIKYLKLNLAKFGNAEIIEKGVWNQQGKAEFHVHHTPTGHSIIPHKVRKGHIEILVDTLDNLFSDRQIDFAKIDVQGAEVQVLEGGDRFLKTTRKLVVETHDRTNVHLRTYPKVLEILKQYDYETRFTMDNGCVYAWR